MAQAKAKEKLFAHKLGDSVFKNADLNKHVSGRQQIYDKKTSKADIMRDINLCPSADLYINKNSKHMNKGITVNRVPTIREMLQWITFLHAHHNHIKKNESSTTNLNYANNK